MFDKLTGRFLRRKPIDPVLAQSGRIFDQHSSELLEQARAFVAEQVANREAHPPTPVSPQAEANKAGVGPTYADFIRFRRNSMVQKLVADTRLLELREEAERVQLTQRIEGGFLATAAAELPEAVEKSPVQLTPPDVSLPTELPGGSGDEKQAS